MRRPSVMATPRSLGRSHAEPAGRDEVARDLIENRRSERERRNSRGNDDGVGRGGLAVAQREPEASVARRHPINASRVRVWNYLLLEPTAVIDEVGERCGRRYVQP